MAVEEPTLSIIANSVINYAQEKSFDKPASWLHDKSSFSSIKIAFKEALRYAFEQLEEQHPQWMATNFDASFFEHEGVPILAQFIILNGWPDPSELAGHWADSLSIRSPDRRAFYTRELEPVAADFLDNLANKLKGQVEGQNNIRTFEQYAKVLESLRQKLITEKASAGTRRDYLNWLIGRNFYLDPRGTFQTQRQVQIKLDEVYISLCAEHDPTPGTADRPIVEKPDEVFELAEVITRHDHVVILGDPGSGKTSLLRFLALRHATALRNGRAEAGAGLGMTRFPILIRIAEYAESSIWKRKALSDFLVDSAILHDCPSDGLSDLLGTELEKGNCLILLDGMDEVVSVDERFGVVQQIENFARRYSSKANRFVVTSRIAGYRIAPLAEPFTHFTVGEMDEKQIHRFLERWCQAVEDSQTPELPVQERKNVAKREIAGIMKAIQLSPGVRRLATNPLLLRILALIYRTGAQLPQKRVELYKIAADTLGRTWRTAQGVPESALVKEEYLIPFLSKLAYWLHVNKSTGMATEREVYVVLGEEWARFNDLDWDSEDPSPKVTEEIKKFLVAVREHTGLFIELAPRRYGFMHLIFEEYYTARYLVARSHTRAQLIRSHLHQQRWEEPILLALGFIGLEYPTEASELVETAILAQGEEALELGFIPSPYEELLGRDYLFALRCLGDNIPIRSKLLKRLVQRLADELLHYSGSAKFRAYRNALQDRLKYLVGSAAESVLRPNLLNALNDADPAIKQRAGENLVLLGQMPPEIELAVNEALSAQDLKAYQTTARSLNQLEQQPIIYQLLDPNLEAFFKLWDNIDIPDFAQRARKFMSYLAEVARLPQPFIVDTISSSSNWFIGAIDISTVFVELALSSLSIAFVFRSQNKLDQQDINQVRRLIQQHIGSSCKIAIVILFEEDSVIKRFQADLASTLKDIYAYDIIIPTRTDLQEILNAPDLRDSLRRLLLKHISLSTLSPYTTANPTSRLTFFGRDRELREIGERLHKVSYVLIGGRRIGKTSMLQYLHVHLLERRFRSFLFNCQYMNEQKPTKAEFLTKFIKDFKVNLPSEIQPHANSFADIVDCISEGDFLIFLIDEADKLALADQQVGWPLFGEMRALTEDHRCQFVFAGEQELYEAMEDSNSPFYNFGTKLILKRLEKGAVNELVTRPMKHQLEIELISEKAIVDKVYDITAGHPSLVQGLCEQLIQLLDQRQRRYITLEDVQQIFTLHIFRDDFLQTFWGRATNLEKIISVVMAQSSEHSFALIDVKKELTSKLGLNFKIAEIAQAMRRLIELRTLLRGSQQGYVIDVKSFPEVVAGIDKTEGLLEGLIEKYIDEHAEISVQDQSIPHDSHYRSISSVISSRSKQLSEGGNIMQQVREQVFISYSHKDKEWLDRLQTTIKPLVRKGVIKTWADTQIEPGAKWREEIRKALASAKVAVLLVSSHFLDSDFIANDELPPLLDAAEKEGLIILWIAVSASMYKETEIATYQAANNPSEPLDSLSSSNLNKELVRIGELIKKKAGLI